MSRTAIQNAYDSVECSVFHDYSSFVYKQNKAVQDKIYQKMLKGTSACSGDRDEVPDHVHQLFAGNDIHPISIFYAHFLLWFEDSWENKFYANLNPQEIGLASHQFVYSRLVGATLVSSICLKAIEKMKNDDHLKKEK